MNMNNLVMNDYELVNYQTEKNNFIVLIRKFSERSEL